jgi:hypothetical protein
VLDSGQGLGEKVRDVEAARHMLDAELLSLDAALQPVEAHVDAFREARCDGLVGGDSTDQTSQPNLCNLNFTNTLYQLACCTIKYYYSTLTEIFPPLFFDIKNR